MRHPHSSAGPTNVATDLLAAAAKLRKTLRKLRFSSPVVHVYNPLDYAWACYESYLRQYALGPKRVVFIGMNPGPFGMVQTGVPFGEVNAVRNWLRLSGPICKPPLEHPRRPVLGLECERSEVSGQRLWGLFASRFGTAQKFFEKHMVLNYCPLAFMEASGRNRTPDKLPAAEKESLFKACDKNLYEAIQILKPDWLIGIGDFAFRRAQLLFPSGQPKVGQILHPSPANPAANRAWAKIATRQLEGLGVWKSSGE
jgi:single-strand selective monofunctional uracil DNA glycosylase